MEKRQDRSCFLIFSDRHRFNFENTDESVKVSKCRYSWDNLGIGRKMMLFIAPTIRELCLQKNKVLVKDLKWMIHGEFLTEL